MSKYSILLVDDCPEVLNTIIEILEDSDLNLNFYHAISGIIAYEIAQNRLPDIILTDWDMPEMNGLELMHKLKQNINTKKIPIIMISGIMTLPENLKKAFEYDIIDFIRKPIENTELIARLKSVLKISNYQKLEIKLKNKELITHATYITKNNHYLLNLLLKMNELQLIKPKGGEEFTKKIHEITEIIKNYSINNSWKKFQSYFQQIHPDFENELMKICPELKPSDIRLAVLLRLNLSSKEIAEISFKQIESIKTARYRLRKKLKLSFNDNLSDFLNNLLIH